MFKQARHGSFAAFLLYSSTLGGASGALKAEKCTKLIVDCTPYGGFDTADTCNQTCVIKPEELKLTCPKDCIMKVNESRLTDSEARNTAISTCLAESCAKYDKQIVSLKYACNAGCTAAIIAEGITNYDDKAAYFDFCYEKHCKRYGVNINARPDKKDTVCYDNCASLVKWSWYTDEKKQKLTDLCYSMSCSSGHGACMNLGFQDCYNYSGWAYNGTGRCK